MLGENGRSLTEYVKQTYTNEQISELKAAFDERLYMDVSSKFEELARLDVFSSDEVQELLSALWDGREIKTGELQEFDDEQKKLIAEIAQTRQEKKVTSRLTALHGYGIFNDYEWNYLYKLCDTK